MSYLLIFTDFSMPVMDGIEATTKIRGVTGHVQDSFTKKGKSAGMNEIYGKPLYNESMKEILKKYYINQ